jgi:hypothetical protein
MELVLVVVFWSWPWGEGAVREGPCCPSKEGPKLFICVDWADWGRESWVARRSWFGETIEERWLELAGRRRGVDGSRVYR